ncbi:MAG: ABC-F family ATP-binding cassette domain-containing protein [Saprospiraceae bacterium]|nr:ABC-F family ATP-binding cassette domain-containing protein [Saprospiraceae bacterium]
MNYLFLENVSKSYGEKVLFRNIDLQISKGQKVALVAKNGTGKTSLLRLIAGLESGEGEASVVRTRKDIRIGYLQQEPDLSDSDSVIEAIFDSQNPQIKAVREYEEAMLFPDQLKRMEQAVAIMEELKAWDVEARVKEILFKLNITDLDKKVGTLSGGQKKRLALAKLLIDEPEFLVLDEPTNHLDLDMIEWLEEYLAQPRLTLFLVTHDRYFLERICDTIVELDNGSLYKYQGNYSEFLEKKSLRHGTEAVELDKAKKLFKRELEWIRRMPKARTTKAKSRVDAFDVIEEKANTTVDKQEIQIDIKGARMGSKILEAHNLNKSYGDLVIVKDFHYKFKKKERVGIIGKNGVGKTTFLRMMTKQERPDGGKVVIGDTVQFGYYTQEGIQMKEDKRVLEVITDIAEFIPLEKGAKLTATQLLERFLFDRKHQQVYVSQLSGGERRRLFLLTVLMRNPNFLILDEPTNDLDILTLNVLEDFLLDFPGCVIIVTHDRYFMDKLVDHLFVFEGDGVIRDFNGNYREYQEETRQKELERRQQESSEKKKTVVQTATPVREASGETKKEIKRLERKIVQLEERKKEIHASFSSNDLDPASIEKLSVELGELQKELDENEERWMEIVESI